MQRWHKIVAILLLSLAGSAQANDSFALSGKPLELVLSWDQPVDLDLFLTGPDGEVVYFANPEARSNNKLIQETNCSHTARQPAPYLETVVVPKAAQGVYRLSVDFIVNCKTALTKSTATISLLSDSVLIHRQPLTVDQQQLKTVAYQFSITP